MASNHAWDMLVNAVGENLPTFNAYTLKGYRQSQIEKIPEYLDMVYTEAMKRYGTTETGEPEVKYLGHRFLLPEEAIRMDSENAKYSSYVDVLRTEQSLMELMFDHRGEKFTTQLYIPYLVEDAFIINGSYYYPMFSLVDKVFYHIVKEHGIGIKILCAHLRFWRNMRYNMYSTVGHVYGEHLVIAKIHLRDYKQSADDLKTVALLYPLVKFGLKGTLKKYGLDPEHITMTTTYDNQDPDFEYFEIRKQLNGPGLYLKIHTDVLKSQLDTTNRIKMQIAVALHYILQYFNRCASTTYTDNEYLVKALTEDETFTVYQVILGKTVFGINYESEVQVAGHIRDHLQSLDIYMDPETKRKLKTIGVECDSIYDLIDYVLLNLDSYVANYYPSNVYNKQVNVLDLFVGPIVNALFLKIYKQTNNRKGDRPYLTPQLKSACCAGGSKAFTKMYGYTAIIAGNPSMHNDNLLLTVLGRRKRSTFSTNKGSNASGKSKKSGSDTNIIQDPEHRMHSSGYIVESGTRTQTTDPTKSGTINGFVPITPEGNFDVPKWLLDDYAADLDKYIHGK